MQGRNVMMGYLNQPEKTDEAITKSGWLRSGDLGTVDDAGFFKITGRAKEILITAGMYMFPPLMRFSLTRFWLKQLVILLQLGCLNGGNCLSSVSLSYDSFNFSINAFFSKFQNLSDTRIFPFLLILKAAKYKKVHICLLCPIFKYKNEGTLLHDRKFTT